MIHSIQQLQLLVKAGHTDWEKDGQVKATYWQGLVQFAYTHECNNKPPAEWNYFERISRGLILDATTGEVVARPFDKFWNWGQESHLNGYMYSTPTETTEKMDGSLGILYRHHGLYKIATRGSFESEQAVWATHWLVEHHNMEGFPEQYTALFEIIYPENRIVVDYGTRRGLVLIGVRDRILGYDHPISRMGWLAEKFGFDLPQFYEPESVEEVCRTAEDLSGNEEGFVIRFDDGARFKIKGAEYVRLHRFVSMFSFKHVAEAVRDDVLPEMKEICPDQYKETLLEMEEAIMRTCDAFEKDINEVYGHCVRAANAHPLGSTEYNKSFARYALDHHPRKAHFLFCLRDGKSYRAKMFKTLFDV